MKAVIGFAVLWFCSIAVNCQIPPKLKFEHDTLFFDPIIDGEKVALDFKFKVIADDKVFIHQVYPGCSCTTPIYSSDTLNPNENGKVKVLYNSAGWGTDTGYLLEKHVYVLYNGGSQVVFFQGRVHTKDTVTKIKFDTLVHDFGTIAKGTTVNHAFAFTNKNLNHIVIEKVTPFIGNLITNWQKQPINFNETSKIDLSFHPTNLGIFTKSINVKTNLGVIVLQIKGNVE